MTSLLEKLQSATAGSRELDAEIAITARPDLYGPKEPAWDMQFGHVTGIRDGKPFASLEAPHYTTSLDAALTLIEGKAHWSASWPIGEAELLYGDGRVFTADAATAPLALCIAALKARTL